MRIFYSNPYDVTTNIGAAYNDFLSSIKANDDDWIVLQDGDIMYLTPNWGRQIHHVALSAPKHVGLIGCMTNRIGLNYQRVEGQFNNPDINAHKEQALSLEKSNFGELKIINEVIAGFFMMFPYRVWKEAGCFMEKSIYFDSKFSNAVLGAGYNTALITGLYVYHLYRPDNADPEQARFDFRHLTRY